MKKIFTIPMMITTVTLLCCCNNDVDRDMLESDPKLVLYCFPGTDNDTCNSTGKRVI